MTQPNDILNFWFYELKQEDWFRKNAALDDQIRQRFLRTYERAIVCELYPWRLTPEGRLAEVIVLDQFPRNMFRDSARSFEADALALSLAQAAVQSKDDLKLEIQRRAFLYMPFMHSESKFIHERAVELFRLPGLETNFDFEIKHKNIIDRFGRYPHRNKLLNRTSTAEELEFLIGADSSF